MKCFYVTDAMLYLGLATSKKEAQRLIEQGAVSVDGEKVTNKFDLLEYETEKPYLFKVGKRKFHKLVMKDAN